MQRKTSFVPGKALFISNCQRKTQRLFQCTILTPLVIQSFLIHLATLLAIPTVYAHAYVQVSHHFMCMRYRHMSACACVRNTFIQILAGDEGCEISRNAAPINNLHSGLKPAAVKW